MKITELIYRAGESGICKLASGTLLEIIYEFENQPNIRRLAEILVSVYGEEKFLTQAKIRGQLFQYLKEEEAKSLCDGLNLEYVTPWDALNQFRLNESRKEFLFDFFELLKPSPRRLSVTTQCFSHSIDAGYGLFSHQEEATRKIKSILSKDRARVLLHMPTGAGKTRTAMNIAVDYLRDPSKSTRRPVIVWLADTFELCEQAYSEFCKAWNYLGIRSATVYKVYGDSDVNFSDISEGFVVCGLQKLNSLMAKDLEGLYGLGNRAGLLIFDEAHKILAPTYHQITEIFQTTGFAGLLGLSATPGRSTFDEQSNKEFAEFFNFNKVTLQVPGYDTPIQYLENEEYLAKVSYHEIPYEETELKLTEDELNNLLRGYDLSIRILNALGKEAKRNIKILTLAIELFNKGKKIIIFACSVESAEAIYALLKYQNIPTGLITADTDLDVRQSVIEKYRNPHCGEDEIRVLVNYGVLTTGFDAPKTNVAIIARPTNSLSLFSQMVGRATRGVRAKGNSTSDIYYIKDTLTGLVNMVEAFSHWDDAWK